MLLFLSHLNIDFRVMSSHSTTNFVFVNVAHPEDFTAAETQTIVRSHARTNKGSNKIRRRRNPVVNLELRATSPTTSTEGLSMTCSGDTENKATSTEEPSRYSNPGSRIFSTFGLNKWSAGSPLSSNLNPRDARLFEESCNISPKHFQPQMPIWFTIAMFDATAFSLTMASAAMLHSDTSTVPVQTVKSIEYYTSAVESVNRRLQDPVESMNEALIGAILGFVCHDVCMK